MAGAMNILSINIGKYRQAANSLFWLSWFDQQQLAQALIKILNPMELLRE